MSTGGLVHADRIATIKKIVPIVFIESQVSHKKSKKIAKRETRHIKKKAIKDVSFGGPAAEVEIEPLRPIKKKAHDPTRTQKSNSNTETLSGGQASRRNIAAVPPRKSKVAKPDEGLEAYGEYFR